PSYLCSVTSFFFNDTATTEIYPLSLHDALPISTTRSTPPAAASTREPTGRHDSCIPSATAAVARSPSPPARSPGSTSGRELWWRSEEHTSELQSRRDLVCRLLLEKKKKKQNKRP